MSVIAVSGYWIKHPATENLKSQLPSEEMCAAQVLRDNYANAHVFGTLARSGQATCRSSEDLGQSCFATCMSIRKHSCYYRRCLVSFVFLCCTILLKGRDEGKGWQLWPLRHVAPLLCRWLLCRGPCASVVQAHLWGPVLLARQGYSPQGPEAGQCAFNLQGEIHVSAKDCGFRSGCDLQFKPYYYLRHTSLLCSRACTRLQSTNHPGAFWTSWIWQACRHVEFGGCPLHFAEWNASFWSWWLVRSNPPRALWVWRRGVGGCIARGQRFGAQIDDGRAWETSNHRRCFEASLAKRNEWNEWHKRNWCKRNHSECIRGIVNAFNWSGLGFWGMVWLSRQAQPSILHQTGANQRWCGANPTLLACRQEIVALCPVCSRQTWLPTRAIQFKKRWHFLQFVACAWCIMVHYGAWCMFVRAQWRRTEEFWKLDCQGSFQSSKIIAWQFHWTSSRTRPRFSDFDDHDQARRRLQLLTCLGNSAMLRHVSTMFDAFFFFKPLLGAGWRGFSNQLFALMMQWTCSWNWG